MSKFGYELRVDHDSFEARIVAVDANPQAITDQETLKDLLRENKVFAGIDEDAIHNAFLRLGDFDEPGETIVIARGKPPQHGKNGDIEFQVDVSGQAAYRGADAGDGSVDFHEATTVTSVAPGDTLAEILPPTTGEDGFSLAGKTLSARNGKAFAIRLGEGVELSADERFCKATREGRPIYASGTLMVSPIFEVPGDVDYNTGNVNFKGHVIVRGNVQDDFAIDANSVTIAGTVGAAVIRSRGPLQIQGGVNGHDKADITAEGDTRCKYVNQAKLTVHGSLVVDREIVNSRIWCGGTVRAAKILGGECLALGGIEAGILGSDMGVNTVLEPGADFQVRKIDVQLDAISEKLEALLRPVEPFLNDRARYNTLPEERKAEFRKAYEGFQKLKDAYGALLQKRAERVAATAQDAQKQVIVRQLVHPDVFVRTDLCMRQFKKQLKGPLALIEDVDMSTIRPARYVPGEGIQEPAEGKEEP